MNEELAKEIRKTIESIKDMKTQIGGLNNYLSALEGMVKTDGQKKVDEAYQRGLEDAWEAARKIVLSPDEGGTSLPDLFAMFGNGSMQRVFRNYSASEAIEKLKAHEEKQESKDSYERGCEGCQWEANVSDTYYPCSKCCNSYKNRYERKEKGGNE